MENITELFKEIYLPQKAIIIYQSANDYEQVYVEAYDMDEQGKPVNAHPLSLQETIAFANCLNTSADLKKDYLKSEGLLPDKILYLNPDTDGCVIWHTKPMEVDLLFVKDLDIPSGRANVPALIWKADKDTLSIYAMKGSNKPKENTELHAAPFFNLHQNGSVCMGTVDIEAENATCLEDFISKWESYFWNSYFSHLIAEYSPVNGNIVQLWQGIVNTGRDFPVEKLVKIGKQLKDLIA